jgi:type IV pilus biogenesis protein PilP
MSSNAKTCILPLFLLISSVWPNCASAGDPSSLPTVNAINGGPVVPPRPEPVGPPSPGNGEAIPVDVGQIPGVLREIGQRQTELTILELEVKRAELQKKLRETESVPSGNGPQFLPAAATQSSVPSPPAIALAGDGQLSVRRIHKIGGKLVALVMFPSGETKDVHIGGFVAKGLRIVEILSDTVYVRQGDQQPYALPVSLSRRGGS